MSLSGDAVNEIALLAQAALAGSEKMVTIGDVVYSTVPLHDLRKADPAPAALSLGTLAGVADYIAANRDNVKLEECVLHVVNPTRVDLLGPLQGRFQQRFHYLQAIAPDRLSAASAFRFGQWMGHQDFIIAASALFENTGDRSSILQLLRRVKVEASVQQHDDGVTQSVETKKGMTISEEREIPNPIMLAPFRTFAEIEQPASPFVLRAKHENERFSVALYEADGGAWQLQAVERIRAWLAERVGGSVTIIG